jgi:hypothetical protein
LARAFGAFGLGVRWRLLFLVAKVGHFASVGHFARDPFSLDGSVEVFERDDGLKIS